MLKKHRSSLPVDWSQVFMSEKNLVDLCLELMSACCSCLQSDHGHGCLFPPLNVCQLDWLCNLPISIQCYQYFCLARFCTFNWQCTLWCLHICHIYSSSRLKILLTLMTFLFLPASPWLQIISPMVTVPCTISCQDWSRCSSRGCESGFWGRSLPDWKIHKLQVVEDISGIPLWRAFFYVFMATAGIERIFILSRMVSVSLHSQQNFLSIIASDHFLWRSSLAVRGGGERHAFVGYNWVVNDVVTKYALEMSQKRAENFELYLL